MQPTLSFEQAPPISVPFRFLLTAPLFGVAAGLLLLWLGPEALASRWAPGALALTHLITTGFMLQAMCGALLQLVPVAAGGNVWRPRLVAGLVHPALIVAALSLVAAFLSMRPPLFVSAAVLFAAALGFYLSVVGIAVLRTPAQGATVLALRIALLGLAATAVLGATLAAGFGLRLELPLIELANIHTVWGLGGWSMVLLTGISYLLVPMFQLTPAYPLRMAFALPTALFAASALASLQLAGNLRWLGEVGAFLALAAAVGYAITSLWLQRRRRRKLTDSTFHLFRSAMIAILLTFASCVVFELFPALGEHPRAPVWLGILVLFGVFTLAINGAVYKIVPFLNWLHLQRRGVTAGAAPNMKQMIAESAIRRQARLQLAAVGLLLAAVLVPELTRPAGALLAASFALLEANLIAGVKVYLRVSRAIQAA